LSSPCAEVTVEMIFEKTILTKQKRLRNKIFISSMQ
jgi:hypothetical protein